VRKGDQERRGTEERSGEQKSMRERMVGREATRRGMGQDMWIKKITKKEKGAKE